MGDEFDSFRSLRYARLWNRDVKPFLRVVDTFTHSFMYRILICDRGLYTDVFEEKMRVELRALVWERFKPRYDAQALVTHLHLLKPATLLEALTLSFAPRPNIVV